MINHEIVQQVIDKLEIKQSVEKIFYATLAGGADPFSDKILVRIKTTKGTLKFVIKLSRFPNMSGRGSIENEIKALLYLHEKGVKGIPFLIHYGLIDGRSFLVEEFIEGHSPGPLYYLVDGRQKLTLGVKPVLEWLRTESYKKTICGETTANRLLEETFRFLDIINKYVPLDCSNLDKLSKSMEDLSIPLVCIHGDLAPQNIIIYNKSETIKILDFQLAKFREPPIDQNYFILNLMKSSNKPMNLDDYIELVIRSTRSVYPEDYQLTSNVLLLLLIYSLALLGYEHITEDVKKLEEISILNPFPYLTRCPVFSVIVEILKNLN